MSMQHPQYVLLIFCADCKFCLVLNLLSYMLLLSHPFLYILAVTCTNHFIIGARSDVNITSFCRFGSTTGTIWLDNVNCFGTESRLASCSRNLFGVHNCSHSQDVAITCSAWELQLDYGVISPDTIAPSSYNGFNHVENLHTYTYIHIHKLLGCSSTQFRCASGECIPIFARCTGIRTCSDGSDERNCSKFCCCSL